MSLSPNYQCEGQLSIEDVFGPGLWSGRMSPEPSVQTVEKTSAPSLKKRQKSQTKMPLFLDMRGDGLLPGASWEMGGPLLGEYTMRSFGEYPSEERESRLSQILEEKPHPKYSLSAKACQGILNRANRKGKELPQILKDALESQARSPSKSGGGSEYDSNGRKAGKGALIQEELSGTIGVSQDQTLITLEGNGSRDSHHGEGYAESETMYTLNTIEKHGVCYGLDRASFNQGQNAQFNISVEKEIAQPLVARGAGGGNDHRTIGALQARDYKGVGNQYVEEGKVIVQPRAD